MSDHLNPPAALLEPSAACAAGDRLPCHLFMPDVAWPETLGPVIRPERARHRVFMPPPVTPWRPVAGTQRPAEPFVPCVEFDLTENNRAVRSRAWRLAAVVLALFWAVVLAVLAHSSRSEAAPVVVVRAPVVVARPAPVAPRPAPPRPVVHVPAPVVVSPSLAKPPVRCERDGLGQCVGVGK